MINLLFFPRKSEKSGEQYLKGESGDKMEVPMEIILKHQKLLRTWTKPSRKFFFRFRDPIFDEPEVNIWKVWLEGSKSVPRFQTK